MTSLYFPNLKQICCSVVLVILAMEITANTYESLWQQDWNFMNYFDDEYNFIKFPSLNSIYPPTAVHIWDLIRHKGIGVYEPIGNLVKAAFIDIVGKFPNKLRLCSLVIHAANCILLFIWLRLIRSNGYRVVVFLTCVIFFVHPLNMEVIGWLSAQNYTISLLFSLMSSICVEYIIKSENSEPISGGHSQYALLATIFYVFGCMAKAPAVVLPLIHTCRLLQCSYTYFIQESRCVSKPGEYGVNSICLFFEDLLLTFHRMD